MAWDTHQCKTIGCLFITLCVSILTACEGTETQSKGNPAVERPLPGKHLIRQMEEMKSDIDKINQKQAERLKQME